MAHRLVKYMAGLLAALPISAAAQDFSDIAKVQYLSGWTTKAGSQMSALSITLEPGWKTYWRKPGDAGIPPVFDWAGSDNLQSVALHWPTPKVFQQDIYHSVGYADQLILPIEIRPQASGKPMSVRGTLQIGICSDVCVPVQLEFDQTAAVPGTKMIKAALADRPMSAQKAGVGKVVCKVKPISDGLRLTVEMKALNLGAKDYLVVELPDPTIWISEADISRDAGRLMASVDMVPATAAPFSLDRSDVRITVLGDDVGVDIQGCSGS